MLILDGDKPTLWPGQYFWPMLQVVQGSEKFKAKVVELSSCFLSTQSLSPPCT